MLDILETVDTRWLRAFMAVADAGTFTGAARTAAMTQSGISQHVARLEDALGVQLFARSKGGAELTEAGGRFRDFVESYVQSVASLKEELGSTAKRLSGVVRYAMPESCLFADHFDALLKVRAKHFPDVQLAVDIRPMDAVYQAVKDGDADFGFVAGKKADQALTHELFCMEEYVLVAPATVPVAKLKAADVLGMHYVDYPGFHELFALWFQRHFPRARTPQLHGLDVVGRVGSLFGVMTMVRAGVGATVVPRQCARPLFQKLGLGTYPAREEPDNQHEIFIVSRAGTAQPQRVRRVIQAFLDMR